MRIHDTIHKEVRWHSDAASRWQTHHFLRHCIAIYINLRETHAQTGVAFSRFCFTPFSIEWDGKVLHFREHGSEICTSNIDRSTIIYNIFHCDDKRKAEQIHVALRILNWSLFRWVTRICNDAFKTSDPLMQSHQKDSRHFMMTIQSYDINLIF